MSPFEEVVRRFLEVAEANARTIERALWACLVLFVVLFILSGLILSW